MINQATNYLPVQQAAVQQQMPMVQNQQAPAPKGPEFNAIKIDIVKPEVKTAADPVYSMPFSPIYSYPPAAEPITEPNFEPLAEQQPIQQLN